MRSYGKLLAGCALLSWATFAVGVAPAADVLVNGGLEDASGPASWTLTRTVTGLPGASVSATELIDQAAYQTVADGLGLLIKSAAGNNGTYAGQNKAVNVTLSQTITAAAGRTYEFTGHSFFQASASGILANIGGNTPLGDYNLNNTVDAADYTIWRDTLGSTTDFRANGTNEGASLDLIDEADYQWWKDHFGNTGQAGGPSPTQSFFRVEFLNSSDVVLSTPVNIDLRSDPTTEAWRTHAQTGIVAPAGTAKARISAIATDMVDSFTPGAGQDVYWDNFSLKQTSIPGVGEKLANPNLETPGAPGGFELSTTNANNVSFSTETYAVHTGSVGLWVRAWFGGDMTLSQTVAATAGADYDFSAWTKWQGGFSGFDPESATQSFLNLEFLDASSGVIGTQSLDLRAVVPYPADAQGEWNQFSVGGTAPAGTASVRISATVTGMENSGIDPQSAMFDDFALIETLPGAGALSAVPEPGSFVLLTIALGIIGVGRRGRNR